MCDRQYGANGTLVVKQGNVYNSFSAPFFSSHLNALEDFDPNRPVANDPFRWIPEGIYYDLFDNTNETTFPITDCVSGYTNQQFFNALDNDVKSMPEFRSRLLQQNNNNQQQASIYLINTITNKNYNTFGALANKYYQMLPSYHTEFLTATILKWQPL